MTGPISPSAHRPRRRDVLSWIAVVLAAVAVAVVAWVCLTAWGAVVHGNPAYALVLGATTLLAIVGIALALRGARAAKPLRVAGRVALLVAAAAGVAVVVWLRPYPAVEPALTAMRA